MSGGNNYRFHFSLSAAVAQSLAGRPLYVIGIDPFGLANSQIYSSVRVAVPGTTSATGSATLSSTSGSNPAPITAAEASTTKAPTATPTPKPTPTPTPVAAAKPTLSCPAGSSVVNGTCVSAPITGIMDSATLNADGTVKVSGWACAAHVSASVTVHLYLGGVAGSGTLYEGISANSPSEPAVASACQSTGSNYRFSFVVNAATASQFRGAPVYVYGISPNAGANNSINNSGLIRMPVPAAPATKAPVAATAPSVASSNTGGAASTSPILHLNQK